MTKEQVFNLLNKAISHIGENFNAEEREYFLDEPLRNANLPFEYSIDSGISKAVILIKDMPFVIKMPFFKYYNDSCYWTEEDEDEEQDDEDFYYDLQGASNINLGTNSELAIEDWDYCHLESVIYQLALQEGLGAYFAEEGYLGTIDFTPVYYQTRCTPMNSIPIDYNSREYEIKESKSQTICNKLQIFCFNEVWISDFIDRYGEEEFKRLNNFLARYDIGDLRSCNIGYLDGAPILFDYSGYRD